MTTNIDLVQSQMKGLAMKIALPEIPKNIPHSAADAHAAGVVYMQDEYLDGMQADVNSLLPQYQAAACRCNAAVARLLACRELIDKEKARRVAAGE